MSEWQEVTLADLCVEKGVQTGPFGSQLHQKDYVAVGTPIITVEHLGDNRITKQNLPCVSDEDKERLSKYTLQEGDIVFSRVGSVDRRAYVHKEEDGWLFSGRCLRVRVDRDKIDPYYLSAYFGLPSFKEYIRSIAVGATMPSLNTSLLEGVPIILPPEPQQKFIREIAYAIEAKIELNQRMNETLEGMARALFKSWFVDFDPVHAKANGQQPAGMNAETAALFPATFTDEGIPDGWIEEPVIESAEYITGAAYKNMHFSEEPEALPVIKIAELKNGITGNTKFTNTELADKYKLDTGDILFSWSGSPDTSINTFIWTGGPAWLNQHIFKVVSDTKEDRCFTFWLLKYLNPEFIEIARNKQTTGLGHVTRKDMQRMRYCKPDNSALNLFYSTVGPVFEKIENNLIENQTLAALRDTLLPKLISGELRVDEADDQIREAVG